MKFSNDRFIPCTMEREISKNIVFRPVRVWHSNSYAGERLLNVSGDCSGCMKKLFNQEVCNIPYTVTHRLYWNKKNPKLRVSAFLSYPDAMGCSDGKYFWEICSTRKDGDIERYFGDDAEKEMEKDIIKFLNKKVKK